MYIVFKNKAITALEPEKIKMKMKLNEKEQQRKVGEEGEKEQNNLKCKWKILNLLFNIIRNKVKEMFLFKSRLFLGTERNTSRF
jgi:hypothetical protein